MTSLTNIAYSKALKLCDERQINEFITSETEKLAQDVLPETHVSKVKWKYADEKFSHISHGSMGDTAVTGKCLSITRPEWHFGREILLTKYLSGKPHIPTLLLTETTREDEEDTHCTLIFPKYNTSPKTRDINTVARQLLTAIEVMHKNGLVHSDIAPANILWDDSDNLVVRSSDMI